MRESERTGKIHLERTGKIQTERDLDLAFPARIGLFLPHGARLLLRLRSRNGHFPIQSQEISYGIVISVENPN